MQSQKANWVQYVTGVLALILVIGLFAGWYSPDVTTTSFPTANEIAAATSALIVLPKSVGSNATLDDDKLNAIYTKILEDDAWEDEAESLATEEWEERDYKDIYRFIRDEFENLADEDDIEYVREDESTDFENMDADDKDGVVTQYLKVRYEDDEGDNRKVYLTIKTGFDEGDLDYQDIFVTK